MSDRLLLTFDYELYLGERTGSVHDTLIDPTDRILNVLRSNEARGIFFVDASYLMRLEKENDSEYGAVLEQLERIVASDCDIGLHIHSQWLDGLRHGTEWRFTTFDRYRIHSLGLEEATEYFRACHEHLRSFLPGDLAINAFRAGGWCLQPFDLLAAAFRECGIKYDFSVVPGLFVDEPPIRIIDYRAAPKNRSFWAFSNDPVRPDPAGRYWAIPVTVADVWGWELAMSRLALWLNRTAESGGGRGIATPSRVRQVQRLFRNGPRPISLDRVSSRLLRRMLPSRSPEFVHCVAHPKRATNVSLCQLDEITRSRETIGLAEVAAFCGANQSDPPIRSRDRMRRQSSAVAS